MTKHYPTPGFDNINDFIRARDTRNSWFKKAAKAIWAKLTRANEEKPKLATTRSAHVS